MLNPYHLAIDVDRCLKLNLSNGQFEKLVRVIEDSEDPETTVRNLIICGKYIAIYVIETERLQKEG
jgi:transcription antitermination factor NusA-like protein